MTVDPLISTRRQQFLKTPFDGQVLKELVAGSLTWLRTNQQTVNALNVFPVPDGDTGTNMVLTMQAAYNEIASSSERNIGQMAQAVAHGALMGARGNSGVILSQIWRGFARGLDHQPVLTSQIFCEALKSARDTAYKGVVRPVEGTILTVSKDVAAAADELLAQEDPPLDIVSLLEKLIQAADLSVQNTPNLLPVLRDAGVVDSGGKGLYFIFEGMLRTIDGLPLDQALTAIQPLAAMKLDQTLESIEPGQDFEVVVDFKPRSELDLVSFYDQLETMGTSIQVGEGDGIYRMHIHVPTDKRYEPIDYIMSLGTVTKVAIENLIAQMEDVGAPCSGEGHSTLMPVEPGQIAVVAVAPGVGIGRVFASLGAAAIVHGGQTMNPSTQEIIHAFENLPTDKVIILPNNKNIILAANTAAKLTVKQVEVIPTRTVPQGLAAIMRLAPDSDLQAVAEDMNAALHDVETGEITTATRSVELDGVEVAEGQIIALHNGKLVLAAETNEEACLGLLEKAHADHFELITLFYGQNISRAEVNQIADVIRRRYSEQELEIQEGCQPHYQFIIAIE